MSTDRDDIIILIDENGNEVEAEYIDTIEYQGNEYVVLLPRDEQDIEENEESAQESEEEEVVILKVEQGAEGEDETFIAIEDEEEQDAVFEIFTQRMMEEVEYIDGDLDEEFMSDDDSPDEDENN